MYDDLFHTFTISEQWETKKKYTIVCKMSLTHRSSKSCGNKTIVKETECLLKRTVISLFINRQLTTIFN